MYLHNSVAASKRLNFNGCRLKVPSALNIHNFRLLLENYKDKDLYDHIEFGSPLNYIKQKLPKVPHKNHASALKHAASVDSYIDKMITRGAVIGPLQYNPFNSPLVISLLQTVDKSGSVDRRVVIDLSYPKGGASVNDGIPIKDYLGQPHNLTLSSVDDLVRLIVEIGPGCKLMKADMGSAYKQLYVDPKDYNLLGFSFRGKLYAELTFPFGARSAALCCQRLTNDQH